ncbi:T9SS type A sorting domain-containing protein [Adhaeribacter soli]|uniref:T9SS type A sorting domain-containing protein n=1 Tax=Adhaeribacter soli TaxID=2607655 RepID=A0A5N1J4P1_9BACT|nr:T9SS type A sorting domain-containing protein [Adhaeribacter soli]KAA9345654.1 T9SS type A sorting domain-containing protein [Adhaeribacter soli]
MKNVKLLTLSLLTGGFLFAANPTQAQFQWAANPDNIMADPGGNQIYKVENTGNDVGEYNGKEFKIMAWDGLKPSFGWDWANGSVVGSEYIKGTSLGTVRDPDIVMDAHWFGRIIITYELDQGSGPEIWAELWEFDGSNMNLINGPQQVDIPGNGPSSNPNIDTDFKNKFGIITFEQNNEIYAHGFEFYGSGGLNGNIFKVSGSCVSGVKSSQPDVALYFDWNTGQTVVSFTYVYDDGSNKVLLLQQEDYYDVLNNGSSNCNIVYKVDYVNSGSVLETPRIAAPHQNISSDPYDVQIVAHRIDNSNWLDQIVAYSMNAGAHGPGNFYTTVVNDQHSLEKCPNLYPAVAFVDKTVVVAWAYEDSNCGIINKDYEIVVRQLDYTGIPYYTDYSIANFDLNGNQYAPSVAGRHDMNNETLYSFYDDKQEYILYKSSHHSNQNLRKGNTKPFTPATAGNTASKAGLNVYPMPVQNQATLQFTVAEGETVHALELYNLTGQKVRTFAASGKKAGVHSVEFNKKAAGSELASGVYLLRLTTNKSSQAIRVAVGN